nr:tRNA 2-selenouridine(34) synthase MnmH [uncultured Carboxylicivirga sp.]
MPIDITIQQYLTQFEGWPLIDVRSPGEFEKGHIPGAVNIELFSNDERAHVGTVYKQQSQKAAIDLGYQYVNPRLQEFIDRSLVVAPDRKVVVHCWRGGMRSHAFAQHLEDNGFKEVYVVEKGYKAFRRIALNSFDNYKINVLGGYTGSGKTHILNQLTALDEQVLDLENIAQHKGSAFGSIGYGEQPTTEQFENNLYWIWRTFDPKRPIWVEDESPNIGNVNIPQYLFQQMRSNRLLFIDISKEERARLLVKEYALDNKPKLADAIQRISKRLGPQATKFAIEMLEEDNFYEVALITLHYYDKYYLKGLAKRDQDKIDILKLENTDAQTNAQTILKYFQTKFYVGV